MYNLLNFPGPAQFSGSQASASAGSFGGRPSPSIVGGRGPVGRPIVRPVYQPPHQQLRSPNNGKSISIAKSVSITSGRGGGSSSNAQSSARG